MSERVIRRPDYTLRGGVTAGTSRYRVEDESGIYLGYVWSRWPGQWWAKGRIDLTETRGYATADAAVQSLLRRSA